MAKKGTGPGTLLIGVAIVIALINSIPREAWSAILIIGIVVVIIWVVGALIGKGQKSQTESRAEQLGQPRPQARGTKTSSRRQWVSSQSEDEAFSSFFLAGKPDQSEYSIPKSQQDSNGNWRWVPATDSLSIAGLVLPGGMIYVGSGLRTRYGEVEPSLIDPKLRVADGNIDASLRLTDYWPSYSNISPPARRAYLQWLAGGRKDPSTNIGYIFLFFYGLERRALIDSQSDPTAKADIPTIAAEVHRLLAIYDGSNSFRRYATHFLDYLDIQQHILNAQLAASPPISERSYELPISLKIGLGQLALRQQPVPASWALAWARSDPNISHRTAVKRCETEFAQLFMRKYQEVHGDGLVLKKNKTKLQFTYQPASGALRGEMFRQDLGDLPDISAVKTPIQKLQAIVDVCTEALDPYSRFIGRNPDKAHALEGLLQLPITLWPAPVKAELEDLKARIGDGLITMSFGELSGRLKSAGALSRDKVLGLARALQELHLGMEPDVLAGTRIPKAEDKIALFATTPEHDDERVSKAYQAAVVTIDLACMAALTDGEASSHELMALVRHIDSWNHLSAAHQKRLKAHLRLGIDQPATLAGLKKKLEPLPADARRSIARLLAHLTQADGIVNPAEVKFLEKTYKLLGLEPKLVYSDLHADGRHEPSKKAQTPEVDQRRGFALDPARIAELQRESAEVSAILANVFTEDKYPENPDTSIAIAIEDTTQSSKLLGLDTDHSAFLRLLVSRSSWARSELVDAASDMELMLDGALESINEATLDAFESPLTDGDDPIEINQEILEMLPV